MFLLENYNFMDYNLILVFLVTLGVLIILATVISFILKMTELSEDEQDRF